MVNKTEVTFGDPHSQIPIPDFLFWARSKNPRGLGFFKICGFISLGFLSPGIGDFQKSGDVYPGGWGFLSPGIGDFQKSGDFYPGGWGYLSPGIGDF